MTLEAKSRTLSQEEVDQVQALYEEQCTLLMMLPEHGRVECAPFCPSSLEWRLYAAVYALPPEALKLTLLRLRVRIPFLRVPRRNAGRQRKTQRPAEHSFIRVHRSMHPRLRARANTVLNSRLDQLAENKYAIIQHLREAQESLDGLPDILSRSHVDALRIALKDVEGLVALVDPSVPKTIEILPDLATAISRIAALFRSMQSKI